MSNEKFICYSALFADDLGAIFIFKKLGEIKKKMDNFLESLSSWLSKLRLRMNTLKCSYTIFSKTGRCNIEFSIKLKNELIPYKANPIFLGIILDERLNFNKHIESLNFRAAKRLNIIKIFSHSKWRMNHHTLKSIYKSLVGSLFDYSSFIIANISESSISSLQRLQNSTIRCIYKLSFNSLNHFLYPISNILPIKEKFKKLGCRHLTKAMNQNNFIIQLVRKYLGSISAITAKYKASTALCVLLPIVALAHKQVQNHACRSKKQQLQLHQEQLREQQASYTTKNPYFDDTKKKIQFFQSE